MILGYNTLRVYKFSTLTNLSLSLNGTHVWNMTGELNSKNSPIQITNLTTMLNNEITECDTPDPNDSNYCLIQLNFTSATAGIVELSGLSVKYSSSTTLTNLSNGPHSVTLYANDTQGNTGSSTVWFTVQTDTTPTTFNITLLQGWNLISLPLVPENTSLEAVLASIEGNYTVVYRWADCIWTKSTAARNPLAEMGVEYGYWIAMTAPDTLELSGTQPALTTINVTNACWNLVGYPSLTPENLTTLLSPINYTVVYAYINGVWKKSTAVRNPLTEMSPGYGYWIYANEDGSYEVRN